MMILAILGAWFLVSWWFSVWSLGFSGKLLRVAKVGFARRLRAVLVLFLMNLGVLALALLFLPDQHQFAWLFDVLLLILQLGLSCLVIGRAMYLEFGWSFLVMALWLLLGIVYAIGTILPMKYFVVEAFVITSSSMAPTLAGPHVRVTCPHCGQSALVPDYQTWVLSLTPPFGDGPPRKVECICFTCLQIGQTSPPQATSKSLDRIIVNKLLKPGRWDLVVFRFPPDPHRIYVQRLIGLPNEDVAIKQGVIWIDGKQIDPPDEIRGLMFLSRQGMRQRDRFDERPWKQRLKDDTNDPGFQLSNKGYYMLGDFTTNSSDSREWGEVPVENILGVASVIYWPPNRWRILR